MVVPRHPTWTLHHSLVLSEDTSVQAECQLWEPWIHDNQCQCKTQTMDSHAHLRAEALGLLAFVVAGLGRFGFTCVDSVSESATTSELLRFRDT